MRCREFLPESCTVHTKRFSAYLKGDPRESTQVRPRGHIPFSGTDEPTDSLRGGRGVEEFGASKYRPISRHCR